MSSSIDANADELLAHFVDAKHSELGNNVLKTYFSRNPAAEVDISVEIIPYFGTWQRTTPRTVKVHPCLRVEHLRMLMGLTWGTAAHVTDDNPRTFPRLQDDDIATGQPIAFLMVQSGGARPAAPPSIREVIKKFKADEYDKLPEEDGIMLPMGFTLQSAAAFVQEIVCCFKHLFRHLFPAHFVDVCVNGSSIAGYGWENGKPFGTHSDYDVAICSGELFARTEEAIRKTYWVGPLSAAEVAAMFQLDVSPPAIINGRPVSYGIASSVSALSQEHSGPTLQLQGSPTFYTVPLGQWKFTTNSLAKKKKSDALQDLEMADRYR
jgi:hypothetical protein